MPVATRGSAKRARDESDVSEEERAAKRPSTPFFRRVEPSFHERARSARKATPTRNARPIRPYTAYPTTRFRDESFQNLPQLMPNGEDEAISAPAEATPAAPATPEQSVQPSRIGWLWNSAKRYIPGLRGEETAIAPATEPAPNRGVSASSSDNRPPASPLDIFARPLELPQPEPETPVQESLRRLQAMKPNTIESFNWHKRHKKWDYAAKAIERDEGAARFNTAQTSGSKKRKITEDAEEPEEPSTPPRNSFQPPSVEDDGEDDLGEGAATSKDAEVLLKTPEKQPQIAPTPLKSALRTGTKAKLNVGFDEFNIKSTTETGVKWRDYGPAGHYTGTTFLDPMDPKNKKHFQKLAEAESPELLTNKDPRFTQPNTFGICDEDIEYGELSEDDVFGEDVTPEGSPPTPPSAPRPSHAELPTSSKQGDIVTSGEGPLGGSIFKSSEAGQKALEEQRARANKYQPKKKSGLSQVEPARSRSSSPPRNASAATAMTATAPADEVPALSDDNGEVSDEPSSPTPSPSEPFAGNIGVAKELDNTIVGGDGMTAYAREHQYDDWAAGLDWPEPQTYVEAGVCSAYIDDLLRKKWTKEDERITREWWANEFENVDTAMQRAKAPRADVGASVWR